jgi:hypothetical protein
MHERLQVIFAKSMPANRCLLRCCCVLDELGGPYFALSENDIIQGGKVSRQGCMGGWISLTMSLIRGVRPVWGECGGHHDFWGEGGESPDTLDAFGRVARWLRS